jgi:hypothetical protein
MKLTKAKMKLTTTNMEIAKICCSFPYKIKSLFF